MCVGLFKAFQFEYKYCELSQKCEEAVDGDTKAPLWFYKYHFLDKINYRLSKPLGNCLTCMASVYSFFPYWYSIDWDFTNMEKLALYPFYIFILAGMNSYFDKQIND